MKELDGKQETPLAPTVSTWRKSNYRTGDLDLFPIILYNQQHLRTASDIL